MLLTEQAIHHRLILPGPFVPRPALLKSLTPTVDRIQTASRRSKPSSCNFFIGEQPNPWELLHPQEKSSRHRGAKHHRRYELLDDISLLSPAYLLSVER